MVNVYMNQSITRHIKEYMMLLLLVLLLIVGTYGVIRAVGSLQTISSKKGRFTVVIDSGHGGIDPGKVGIDGSYEKDINLAISLKLKKKVSKSGCKVIMTRESDAGLYKESDVNKKTADLRRRVEIMNSNNPDVIISIHQNSFTQESSKGAQVFYQTSSDDGKKLAEIMQMQLVEDLDKNNHRVAKPNSDYYILKNSTGTAIIVECGFLSNKEESALLCSNDYQEKVADSISKGIIKYLEGGKDGNKDTED